VVVVEMKVEMGGGGNWPPPAQLIIAKVVCRRRGMFAVEKGMLAAVVASTKQRRPFIGTGDMRRGGK
jgi:hypothetical protein